MLFKCAKYKLVIIAVIAFAFEVTKNNTKLAVVDIGYGDGILRTRAKHEALINGKRYRYVH